MLDPVEVAGERLALIFADIVRGPYYPCLIFSDLFEEQLPSFISLSLSPDDFIWNFALLDTKSHISMDLSLLVQPLTLDELGV